MAHGCQKLEVRIRCFESGAVPSGTGSNYNVRGRCCYTLGTRSPRQITCLLPDIFVNRKLWKRSGELPQNLLFLLSGGAIP